MYPLSDICNFVFGKGQWRKADSVLNTTKLKKEACKEKKNSFLIDMLCYVLTNTFDKDHL